MLILMMANKQAPKWKLYGMQPHPTKDKKRKPVIHDTASIGTEMICVLKLETIVISLANMLTTMIKHLSPTDQPAMRWMLTFFIDQGSLKFSEAQSSIVTNLIQIRSKMNVKFLTTIKKQSNNLNGNRVMNSKVLAQKYGM